MKIRKYKVNVHNMGDNCMKEYYVEAKTPKGALIVAIPYRANDFKYNGRGVNGDTFYVSRTGNSAIVYKI